MPFIDLAAVVWLDQLHPVVAHMIMFGFHTDETLPSDASDTKHYAPDTWVYRDEWAPRYRGLLGPLPATPPPPR